ncbi:MAG TPA: TIGR00180 family glycosyltransferase [Xanthobacteraceae bacterium]|jgi:glycosyltransferase domain-containing protein|nr:TIGR00180 family glycosyltransferase [Xanthobacteraceae bacterium]
MTQRLTIVVPLRGRPLFTLRFLWHANAARLPYKFIIADGEVRPDLSRLLDEARKLFPHIDVDYIRYPDDTDFGRYFAKMTDALARVQTPYVMLADNDDFLAFTGLEQSIDFLEANPDYVCCGGGIGGFAVYARKYPWLGGLCGPLNRLAYRYMPYDRSLDLGSPSPAKRLSQGLRNSWSYYAVFRSPALLTIWREVVDMNLSDLQLHEKYCAMRTLTLGKARSDRATIAYFRQYWTTLRSAFPKDWVHHLVRSRFNTDFAEILARISRQAAAADGADEGAVAEDLRGDITSWFGDFLRRNYGPYAALRRYLRNNTPNLLAWVKTRRRVSVPFEQRSVLAKLRRNGASKAYLEALAAELAQIEDVVSGAAFADFIRPYVPLFVPEAAQKAAETPAAQLGTAGRGQSA